MIWLLAAACAVATVPAGLRWLRVAQREHYLAPSVSRFAWRWWTNGRVNVALGLVGLGGVIGSLWALWPGFLVAAAQIGPIGLSVRGSTAPLAWTPRLLRLATTVGFTAGLIYAVGAQIGSALLIASGLLLLPSIVDLALAALSPVERAMGSKWVERAAQKLATINPKVVAITGSYGKTTTKGYVGHLLAGHLKVVATPASFNNRMGLARAVNENLTSGTEVFIAEMGTYAPGEIADMCSWVTPTVAAIVSLGPVHLERFGSLERILAAKAEILDRAGVGVICVDHPLLARLSEERSASMPIVSVSTGERGRVQVTNGLIVVDGLVVGDAPDGAFGANLAVAVGVCVALDLTHEVWARRLADLPNPAHRQTVSIGESGVTIIDDTFNSNPDGAKRALATLGRASNGAKAVVTPGMVELGPVQEEENTVLAREVAAIADHLVIVGRTNRASLLSGAADGGATVTVVGSREEAVAWVRANLSRGDTVLYENDLPDHYP